MSKSQSLRNIPHRKLQERILLSIQACKNCSHRKIESVEQIASLGVCPNCALKSETYNRYYSANIPVEYWDLNISKNPIIAKEHFKGPEKLLEVYFGFTKDLRDSYTEGRSFCLAGLHGIGKSSVVSNILKKCCRSNLSALYSTLSDSVSALTSAPNEDRYLARKELLEVDFLGLDEVDARFFHSENAADLFGRTLESIIRTRISNKLPTILISNSPNPKEMFNGPLKVSIESLLNRIPLIPVIGKDYRKIMNQALALAVEEKVSS